MNFKIDFDVMLSFEQNKILTEDAARLIIEDSESKQSLLR